MIKKNTAAALHAATLTVGAPISAFDLTGYTKVTILLTVTINGHEYKRGTQPTVDTPTLASLQAAGAILM